MDYKTISEKVGQIKRTIQATLWRQKLTDEMSVMLPIHVLWKTLYKYSELTL